VHARQDAGFEEQYHVTRRLSFNGAAAFDETEAPAELNLATALTPARTTRAGGFTLQPSAITDSLLRRTRPSATSPRTTTCSASVC
jgi:hypothetical protein